MTNQRKAWATRKKLMSEYAEIDQSLRAAVDSGASKSGCLIAYASSFSFGMDKLLTAPARTRSIDLYVWEKMAREDMDRARNFLASLRVTA